MTHPEIFWYGALGGGVILVMTLILPAAIHVAKSDQEPNLYWLRVVAVLAIFVIFIGLGGLAALASTPDAKDWWAAVAAGGAWQGFLSGVLTSATTK